MKYLRKFFEYKTIYEEDWHKFVPDGLVVIKGDTTNNEGEIIDPKTGESTGKKCFYKLGNIMSDLVYQVTYDKKFETPGIPETLEFDVAVIENGNNNKFELDVEITFGDLICAGFKITAPNVISVYQYTSYFSKNDPSNTVFAFDEDSLSKIVKFFNSFDSINIDRSDLNFLDKNPDNYRPN